MYLICSLLIHRAWYIHIHTRANTRFSIARKQITRFHLELNVHLRRAIYDLKPGGNSTAWNGGKRVTSTGQIVRWRDKSMNRCRTKRTTRWRRSERNSSTRSWFKSPRANCRRVQSRTRFHEMLLTSKKRSDEGATVAQLRPMCIVLKTWRVMALKNIVSLEFQKVDR